MDGSGVNPDGHGVTADGNNGTVTADGNELAGEKYYQVFRRVFPYYLSIGMTYEQFWEMDSSLVRAFRKADRLRKQEENFGLWLQGRYIYDALCCAAPIFRSLAKPGTTAHPYMDKPYDIYPDKPAMSENDRKKQRGLAAMRDMAMRFNKSFHAKEAKRLAGMKGNPDPTATPPTDRK